MASRTLFALIFIGLFVTTAHGQTNTNNQNTNQSQITSISNSYSNLTGVFLGEINTSATVIHGGVAGTLVEGCADGERSSGATCDNCSDDFASCNSKRVHNDLNLTIQFRPVSSGTGTGTGTPVNGGRAFVTNNVEPSQGEFASLNVINQNPSGLIIPANVTTVSVTVNWGDICREFFNGPTGCEDAEPGQQTIRLGIDENNDNQFAEQGVTEVQISLAKLDIGETTLCTQGDSISAACNFVAYPGDKKVFIEEVRTDCSFPTVGESTIEFIRVFIEPFDDGVNDVPNASSTAQDLVISADSTSCSTSKVLSFANNLVENLDNDKTYRFSIGLLDQANNLGGILNLEDAPSDPEDPAGCYSVDPDFPLNCHVATPEEVLGLVEKEFDCFITTATYGTPFRPKVEDFRAFRNKYLHNNWLGRKIIKFYYKTSPPLAEWIRNHPGSKPLMRGILYPFWLFAKICLLYPIIMVTTLLLLLTGVFWRLTAWGVRR